MQRMQTSKKKIILVCHASTGSGHKTAAEAIAGAMQQITDHANPGDYKIQTIDMLDFCVLPVDGNKAAAQYTGPMAPFHDVTWRYNFTGRIVWGGGKLFSTFLFPRFLRKIKSIAESYNIAAVVCTHMVAANVICGVRAKLVAGSAKSRNNDKSEDEQAKLAGDAAKSAHNAKSTGSNAYFPIISVPTDYETEGLWPHAQSDLFCVATDYMVETLQQRRVPRNKIALTGMPAAPGFTHTYNKAQTLKKFNLSTHKVLALIMAGASESQPYVNIRKILSEALPYLAQIDWIDFAICTGKDSEYKYSTQAQVRALDAQNIRVLGYTDQMAPLMQAADVAICKAGGMTVTECLCSRLPMILVGKAYAQENINVRFLTSIGAAYHCTTYKSLVETLCNITSNPELFAALQTNTDNVRRPDAAFDIARCALIMAGTEPKSLDFKKPAITKNAVAAYNIFKRKQNAAEGGGLNSSFFAENIGLYLGGFPAHSR